MVRTDKADKRAIVIPGVFPYYGFMLFDMNTSNKLDLGKSENPCVARVT